MSKSFSAMLIGSFWERTSHSNRLPVVTVYVRPSCYAKGVMDKEELFTLSLLQDNRKKALGYIGSHTGRDGDKIIAAGLTPLFIDGTNVIEKVFRHDRSYQTSKTENGNYDAEREMFRLTKEWNDFINSSLH